MNDEAKEIVIAQGWLERANNKITEAKEHMKYYHYSESISASQECIELSIKSIFILIQKCYPKRHEFKEEEFELILNNIPKKLQNLDLPKLYLYSKFWSEFYTVAKYGLEKIATPAQKLFEKEEAELAIKHADKCYWAAFQLNNYTKHPW